MAPFPFLGSTFVHCPSLAPPNARSLLGDITRIACTGEHARSWHRHLLGVRGDARTGGPLAIERARLCRDRSLLNGLGSAAVFIFFVMEALRKRKEKRANILNPSFRSARLTGQVLWAYRAASNITTGKR